MYFYLQWFWRAVAAGAQVLVDGNSGPGAETVNLTRSVQFQNISVTAASATQFTVTVTEQSVPNIVWVKACIGNSCATESSASPATGTTNTTLSISLANDLGSQGAGPFNATVTLTPAGGNTSNATSVAVVFTPGQSVTPSTPVTPSSLTVGVPSGGTATNMVILQKNSGASFDITQNNTTTTDGNPWLSASATPMTGITAGSTSTITI